MGVLLTKLLSMTAFSHPESSAVGVLVLLEVYGKEAISGERPDEAKITIGCNRHSLGFSSGLYGSQPVVGRSGASGLRDA